MVWNLGALGIIIRLTNVVGTQERLVTLVRPEEQDDANLRDAGGHEE
jgi:hypothetical protein